MKRTIVPVLHLFFSFLWESIKSSLPSPLPTPPEEPVSCHASMLKSDPSDAKALFFLARAAHRHSHRTQAPDHFHPSRTLLFFPSFILSTSALIFGNSQGNKAFICFSLTPTLNPTKWDVWQIKMRATAQVLKHVAMRTDAEPRCFYSHFEAVIWAQTVQPAHILMTFKHLQM